MFIPFPPQVIYNLPIQGGSSVVVPQYYMLECPIVHGLE